MTRSKCPSCDRLSLMTVTIEYVDKKVETGRCLGCGLVETHEYRKVVIAGGKRSRQPEGLAVTKTVHQDGEVQYELPI